MTMKEADMIHKNIPHTYSLYLAYFSVKIHIFRILQPHKPNYKIPHKISLENKFY